MTKKIEQVDSNRILNIIRHPSLGFCAFNLAAVDNIKKFELSIVANLKSRIVELHFYYPNIKSYYITIINIEYEHEYEKHGLYQVKKIYHDIPASE